ncbi:MAG: helix-turn-helix domain-containing protein, partial [Fervidicoccaceae archaeon]
MSERLLRPKEVCKLLGVSYTTLRRWIKEGRVKAVQTIGGKYRIPESEVRRILSRAEVREIRAVIYTRV